VDTAALMDAIDEQEARLHALAEDLVEATEAQDWAQVRELDDAYRAHEAELNQLMSRWEAVEAGA
jgi:hypothetical protein